jgi:amidase
MTPEATPSQSGYKPGDGAAADGFRLEEATIAQLHDAIRSGATTCVAVVQQYIDRARAYNGVSSQLVTADGAPVRAVPGTLRATRRLEFPTETVPAATLFPDYQSYLGPPLEFGRMEPTASDPAVYQQYGMVVGIPHASGVNALATLNIRGERSVTCRGDYDLHPSLGPLPPGAPPVCEFFRQLPDALEQAAALDAEHGTDPDLCAMPLYGVTFAFKDTFDTKEMRSTGGGDAAYDIDFPARDHILVEQLRKKGAIIYAKAVNTEYNGRVGDPGGRHSPDRVLPSTRGFQRSSWGGNPSNPYDTTRSASLGSSSGSALSVSTNLVMCSLGEETRASTRGPSNHNSVALILPHKGLIGYEGGAIGSDLHNDRTGIHARSVIDAAKVLDALRDPAEGYYDSRDPYTTVPRSSVLPLYTPHVAADPAPGELTGVRLGVIRESMVTVPGACCASVIPQAAAAEIKGVLGGTLSATLVESGDPLWTPDPDIEQMTLDFRGALARLVPVFMPDILFRVKTGGSPVFPDVAAAIRETEFAPGVFLGSGDLHPADYLVMLAEGLIPPPANLNISTVQDLARSLTFRFHITQYLTRRASDWSQRGYTETLASISELNSRSKFWGDDQRAWFANWEEVTDIRNPHGERQGISERITLREVLRRADMMVIYENHLDALVRLHTPMPPGRIGYPNAPGARAHHGREYAYGPNGGLTEILIPAGYVDRAYDPVFVLSEDRRSYLPAENPEPTFVDPPGLPFSLVFRAEPGKEDICLRIASAYERISHRRVSPPAFGPLPHYDSGPL